MNSVRKGLRDGDLEKDTYDRVICASCEQTLKTRNDPEEVFSIRICPVCETEYKDLR